ncbi:MAG: hypothetical protein H8K07_00180 [Nitrospira sp.]|nr:hypothetical protein [Nitrospira sp.]
MLSVGGETVSPQGTPHDDRGPVGVVVAVHGPVVDIACDYLPPLHQALSSSLDRERYIFEVYQHLNERHVRAITLHSTGGLQRGMRVFDTGAPLQVPVSPDCLGRLLNVFGEPLDGGPALNTRQFRNILGQPIPLHQTIGASGILETGIKVIDLLCPFIRGGKTGLFGGAGIGNTQRMMAQDLHNAYRLVGLYLREG